MCDVNCSSAITSHCLFIVQKTNQNTHEVKTSMLLVWARRDFLCVLILKKKKKKKEKKDGPKKHGCDSRVRMVFKSKNLLIQLTGKGQYLGSICRQ